jgi:hypothetical protein
VLRVAELIEKTSHTDPEIEEITAYLRSFDQLRSQLDILNKIQIKRVSHENHSLNTLTALFNHESAVHTKRILFVQEG